jgi:D-tagatose-1,6-bisphosphate aldolase subunit GatZ/KbaZ
VQLIGNIVARHKQGEQIGVTSVCSAHPLVIEATFAHALRHDTPVVWAGIIWAPTPGLA